MLSTNLSIEQALIQRAQSGDDSALGEIYHRYAPAVFRYFLFRTNDAAAAEDLTAEVFVRLVSSVHRYRDQGVPFAAWLFRIAHDRAVDHQRYAARHPTETLSDNTVDPRPGPESQVAHQADKDRLSEAMRGLTDDQQLTVQLRFIEGYNLEDTAQIMGKTVGAVKALQHRALQNLSQRLKP